MRVTKSLTTLCLAFPILICNPTNCHAEEKQTLQYGYAREQDGHIFPGESFDYRGVRVTWEMSGQPKDATGSFGSIRLVSDQEPSQDLSLPVLPKKVEKDYSTGEFPRDVARWDIPILVGDVFLSFSATVEVLGPDPVPILESIYWVAFFQPQHQAIDSKPYGGDALIRIALSSLTPVYLNDWILSIGMDMVTYPDGNEYFQVRAYNPVQDTTVTLPAVFKNKRSFDRFTLEVTGGRPEGPWNLTYVTLSAEPDLTIRGGDTYVPDGISINDGETLGAFLDRMSKQYGFEVEWVEYPGHPESVEFLKNLSHPGTNQYDEGNAVLSYQITTLTNTDKWQLPDITARGSSIFSLSWPDAKHLRVETVGYDKILADAEENRRLQERAAQAHEEWERDYKLEVKVYSLKKITPVTAKALIEPHLRVYRYGPGSTEIRSFPTATGRQGESYLVEQCVADDKANAVIVTAIPATHKKIEELLTKMEGMVTEGSAKGPVKQYPLEVFLLRGTQQAPTPPTATTQSAQPADATSTDTTQMIDLKDLGISKEDLEFFGPKTSAQLLGRGAVTLIGQPGEEGKTLVALTQVYACKIEFLDVREPYLILKGSLEDVSQGYEPAKKLLENTLYLEPGKPSLLGLTNLREALILLVKWREE